MTSLTGKCWFSHFSFTYLLTYYITVILICNLADHDTYWWQRFSFNYDGVAVTWIRCMINITISKMADCMFHIFQANIFHNLIFSYWIAWIWLSHCVTACCNCVPCWWCPFCFLSTSFLMSHFTNATIFGFLDRTANSIATSRSMKISFGFFLSPKMPDGDRC